MNKLVLAKRALFTIMLFVTAGVSSSARAASPSPKTAEALHPVFEQFCFDCHGPDGEEAGLNFAALLTQQPLIRNQDTWARVMGMLKNKAMPPEDEDQPSSAQRRLLLEGLDQAINHFDYSKVDNPGFEPIRRLTHTQYDNTLRDLFEIDLKQTGQFPSELTGASGFDNSANTLFLQSSLMERYIAVAERVVELALPAVPTTADETLAHETIFIAKPGHSVSDDEAAEKILSRFLLRAYRRPPTDEEVKSLVGRYEEGRAAGQSFEAAIKQVLPAVLISPKFLLRVEAGQSTDQSYRVSDWELASRLSYFLWASMPDDELFDLAAAGKLHESEVLAAQVKRMLADPRADTLGNNFAAQWLSFQYVGTRIRLDPIDNAWCTDTLMTAMRDESSMFFMSLLRENQPIDRMVDADYTFVNEELATTLYKMKGVHGKEMRRVALDDPNRGGIFGQASMLAVTSNYKRTSPIKRGIWILDAVLGTPPPPPPPNAGKFEAKLRRNRKLTFREKLKLHSKDATCRACHAKIDPMGFALENFDYFGRWRDTYESGRRRRGGKTPPSKPVDASATLPDGTAFSGPTGLKHVILEKRHDALVRQVTSKLLAYALGRQLEYYDEPAIRKIVSQLEENDFRFQTLLQAIVTSYPFQYRKNPTQESTL